MTTHAGFLQEIIEHPDNDAPRLIYADWLEEQGDSARAAFIRAQCQPARWASSLARFCQYRCDPSDPFLPAATLAPEFRRAFLTPLLDLGLEGSTPGFTPDFDLSFRRGFVEHLGVVGSKAAEKFVNTAERLFALTPLRHVFFDGGPWNGGPFADYSDPMSPDTLRQLVNLPPVARLAFLGLVEHAFTDKDVPTLIESPFLGRGLLILTCNLFSDAAKAALRERFGDRVVLAHELSG